MPVNPVIKYFIINHDFNKSIPTYLSKFIGDHYIYKNINYSQFEHFYNNTDLLYNTINAGLHSSSNILEGFNKLDISHNLISNYFACV